MMFWIIIEKFWRIKPLIIMFGKLMPFGSACDERSSWKDVQDNGAYTEIHMNQPK